MKRDKKLLQKRMKKAGFLLLTKKESGMSYKRAFIETCEIFSISEGTLKNDLKRFNREVTGV